MEERTPGIGFSSHKLNKCQIPNNKMPKCTGQFTIGFKGHMDDISLSLHNPWGECAFGKSCFKVPKKTKWAKQF